jgi:hypothetical protein
MAKIEREHRNMAKIEREHLNIKHVPQKCHRVFDILFENNWNKIVMCDGLS